MSEHYRIHEDCPLYFLTMSVVHWLPIFITEEACCQIVDSLNFCHQEKALRINAFVIMPTHLHLIVFDADFDGERLRQTMTSMRKFTGRHLADYCDRALPPLFGQALRGGRRTDRVRHFWQPRQHPVAIFSEPFWRTKFNYIHDNPR